MTCAQTQHHQQVNLIAPVLKSFLLINDIEIRLGSLTVLILESANHCRSGYNRIKVGSTFG
jgi:hypothetical protein